jgi:foldase protein PrsA
LRINKNYGLVVLALILIGMIIVGQTKPTVAEYADGKKISEPEYKNYVEVIKAIEPNMKQSLDAGNKEALTQILHFQVMNRYIADQVKDTDEDKKKAENDLNQFEASIKQQLGTGKSIDSFYTENNVTKDEVKAFFLDQAKMISYFAKDIPEADKKKTYENAKKQGAFIQADVRHILIGTEKRSKAEAKKKAEDLVKQLRAGADFAKLAKENTDDPGSAQTGGLYQYNETQPLGQTVEAYRNAAMTLPLNKISDPIETTYGYHIMRVEKRSEQTYEEAKKQIEDSLAMGKESEFFHSGLQKIIKKETIPASMIKNQPAQQPGPEPSAPGQTTPGNPPANK